MPNHPHLFQRLVAGAAEEVEEVLKEHAGVRDAVVVGVPDERFGEVIVAWVEPAGEGDV